MRVELDTNGTIEEIPFNALKESDRLGEPWDGRVLSYREDVETSSAKKTETEVTVTDGTTTKLSGRLNDIEFEGNRAWLLVDSWEIDANDARLAKGANSTGDKFEEVYSTDSQTIFEDAINNVDSLSIGTVASGASTNTNNLVFSNTPHGKKTRQLELGDSYYTIYNYDKTVDYLADPGQDKTGTTLQPSSDLVSGDMNVTRGGFDDGYSHILLLGAGAGGDDQLSYTVTLNANPDREKEKRIQLKNVYSEDRLQEIGSQLQSILQQDLVNVTATIRDTEVNIGDQYNVVKSKENLDRDLYVVEYERRYSGVELYDVVLSSRRKFRDDIVGDVFRDIESYRTSKEPPVVFVNGGGGNRSTADSGSPFEMSQPVPVDVVHERQTLLHVRGRPYRAFSQGTGENIGGEATGMTTIVTPDSNSNLSFSTVDGIPDTPNDTLNGYNLTTWFTNDNSGSKDIYPVISEGSLPSSPTDSNVIFTGSVKTISTNEEAFWNYNSPDGELTSGNEVFSRLYDDSAGDWLDFTGNAGSTYSNHGLQVTSRSLFDNPPEPGLIESFPDNAQAETDDKIYPDECDIRITDKNGTSTVATGVGPSNATDGWEEIVDITGEIDFPVEGDPDSAQFIDIEVEPSSLGHIELAFGGRYALENTLQ